MRILFISHEQASLGGTGGVGTYTATISAAMAARGHDVHVLSCRENTASSDELVSGVWVHTRSLIRIRGLRLLWRGQHSRRRAMLLLSNYREARTLGTFDVIEAPEWLAEALLFVARRRVPVVVHLHTPHQVIRHYEGGRRTLDDRLSDHLEKWTTRHAAAITSPSQLVVDRLRSMTWLNDRPVEIIRYPVDLARFDRGSSPSSADEVIAIGRIEHRKAPELLVEAAAVLLRQGIGVKLRLLGRSSGEREGRPYAEWIAQLAQQRGVDITISREIPWAEIPDAYRRARAVFVCSRFESFSMAVVEAMAAGRPVVTTRTVGASEVIHTEPAQCLDDLQIDKIALVIKQFLADARYADVVGRANREDVTVACHPDQIALQRETLFAAVAARFRPAT